MPQGAQWYNKNICSARRKIPPKSPYLTPWGHMSITHHAPGGNIPQTPLLAPGGNIPHLPSYPWRQHFINMRPLWGRFSPPPYCQAEYNFSMKPGMAAFSIQRPTTTRSLVLSTKIKLVPFPTCM